MISNSINKKEVVSISLFISLSSLAVLLIGPLFNAATAMGLNAATATSVYYALNIIGWGVTAASIVASFGLASIGAYTIWAAVKKMALKQFIKW
ncbi:hypothetical protein [Staphylococcus simulans]|uniref:hypothetical protein n=1 Tax=Staphylococcus simulans TaxID=1286 RepID=UPI000D031B8F|nr:hypothetical protein [Staphylococcus simulans]PTI91545.1 hypothetical protein BU045_12595 [Staphylococcus simulans]PTJ02307.1 hypothetical protein BU046_12445 [Staphylococcus simulans]PTJ94252.1 hypothetical protein BU013_12735 [Staphylococcus simulans]RIN77266.1 hypothetical protein BU016_12865 [Staphylococcus simulans]